VLGLPFELVVGVKVDKPSRAAGEWAVVELRLDLRGVGRSLEILGSEVGVGHLRALVLDEERAQAVLEVNFSLRNSITTA
jgi:hypothetical protein